MINAFLNGLAILGSYWLELLVLCASGLGFGAVSALLLFRGRRFDERVACVLPLGFVFVGVVAPALSLLRALSIVVVGLTVGAGIAALVVLIRRGAFSYQTQAERTKNIWAPLLLFALFLILRLGFLQGLVLPPFSDSAEHFEKLAALLGLPHAEPFTLATVLPFYHRGFHGIVAWVDTLTGDHSPLSMAVAAHFLSALLPVGIYFLVLALTEGDFLAALFGAFLGGFGWIMPAYAINFGKYPSLAAVSMLPLLLAVFHLTSRSKGSAQWDWWLYIGATSIALVWIHSRASVVLAFFYATYCLGRFLASRLPVQILVRGALGLSLLAVSWIMVLDQSRTGSVSVAYYLGAFDNSTFLVVALWPFAVVRSAGKVLEWVLIMLLVMLAANAPLPGGVYHYPLTLLDQLFFDLILFLPLTVLGALGLNAAGKLLPVNSHYFKDLFLFLLAIVLVNGVLIQPWQVLGSTDYVTPDDIRAFAWIQAESPPTSEFVIAALAKTANYSRASDAGIWIEVLTGRTSIKLPYQFQWDSVEAVRGLCEELGSRSPVYVYVGHLETSFAIPECAGGVGLEPALCYPRTKLFALDCDAHSP
jgi:hypothetical protein